MNKRPGPSRFLRAVPGVIALLLCAAAIAPAVSRAARTMGEPTAAPTVSVAPPETRTVVAEGRAAINFDRGGVPAAREAAIAQALRAAVEKATGVFVSARTLTSNYQLVQDEVTTRAEGFATLGEIVSEQVRGDEVRVTIRALVSLRPLAERLKALNLTRAWTVRVTGDRGVDAGALAQLQQTLTEAGFHVESSNRGGGSGLFAPPVPRRIWWCAFRPERTPLCKRRSTRRPAR
jgi:hypothetical protein